MYVESSLRKKTFFIDFLRNGFRARFFLTSSRDDDNDERQNFLCSRGDPKKENFCSSVLQKQRASTY